MDRKNKIKDILNRLNALDSQRDGFGDIHDLAERMIQEELPSLTETLKNTTAVKGMERISNEFKKFKSEFDLKSLISAVEALAATIEENDRKNEESVNQKIGAVAERITRMQADSAVARDTDPTPQKLIELKQEIEALRSSLAKSGSDNETAINQTFLKIDQDFAGLAKVFRQQSDDHTKTKGELEKELLRLLQMIEESRQEFNTRLQNRGGSSNQKISVNGSVMSLKFADINLIGAITKADNNVTKEVDITFSGSSVVGTVLGPAGATDNAIARFDGATGAVIQNSSVLVTDDGNVSIPNAGSVAGYAVTIDAVQPLTNKTILSTTNVTTQMTAITDSATPTPTGGSLNNRFDVTALAQAAAFAAPSGTPAHNNKLIITVKDNATARALTWNAIYTPGGVALPSTTVLSKIMTLGFIYSTANALNKWQLVAASFEA